MNSSSTYLDLKPDPLWQSTTGAAETFAALGRRSVRSARSWRQRAAIISGVILLEILLAVALIRGGCVTALKLPEAMTVVMLPHQDLVIKAPPPTMPQIVTPIVPVQPITIEVQSETAITLPAPRQETASPPSSQNTGGGTSALLSYQAMVLRQIDGAKRYPPMARAQHRQGIAIVQFDMDRTGRVLDASLVKSSHTPSLDEESVEAVKRASPFPAPPPELAGNPVALMVAVEFNLH